MPHLKYDSVTGHLLFGPTGHLVHTCDEGPECDACQEGTAQTSYTVTIGGTIVNNETLCEDCEFLKGTFVLTLDPASTAGSCLWTYDYEETCSGNTYSIELQIQSGQCHLHILRNGSDAIGDWADNITGVDCSGASLTALLPNVVNGAIWECDLELATMSLT